MEQVVELLRQTWNPSGENPGECLRMATEALDSFGFAPDFCACLCEIIVTEAIEIPTRQAAAIRLTQIIDKYWGNGMLDDTKAGILGNYLRIVTSCLGHFYGIMANFTRTLVDATGLAWQEMFGIIQAGLSSQNDGERVIGLMLSKAVAFQFRSSVADEAVYQELSANFLGPLTQFVVASENPFQLAIAYQIARHFSIRAVPGIFLADINMLNAWFQKALAVAAPSEDPAWPRFVQFAVKFCAEYFYRYPGIIAPEIKLALLDAIVSVTVPYAPPKVLGRCVQFLKLAMDDPVTWDAISGNLLTFTRDVLLPLWSLDDDDFAEAADDPPAFLQNFHTKGYDTSDPRYYLWNALRNRASKSPALCTTFVQLLKAFLGQTDPRYDRSKYSMCHLFSSVVHCVKDPSPFIDPSIQLELLPLLNHPSFIVRAGVLVALTPILIVHPQTVVETIGHLEDPSILVQYLTTVALSSFLEQLSIRPETSEAVGGVYEMCAPILPNILGSYFRITQMFNDYQIIESTVTLVRFFAPQLMTIAAGFSLETYKLFLQHCGNGTHGHIILSSIARFLEMTSEHPEIANQVISALLPIIGETIGGIPPYSMNSVIELLSTMIAEAPVIGEDHWKIIGMITPLQYHFRKEVSTTYKNLIIKDQATARNPETADSLLKLAFSMFENIGDPNDLTGAISLMSTVLMAVKGVESINTAAILPQLMEIVVSAIQQPITSPYASMLFGAMLLVNCPGCLELIASKRGEFLHAWLETVPGNVLMVVCTNCYASFTQEELPLMMLRGVQLIQKDGRKMFDVFPTSDPEREIFEELERKTHVCLKSLEMFNEKAELERFVQLLGTLDAGPCQGITASIEAQIQEPLMEVIGRRAALL